MFGICGSVTCKLLSFLNLLILLNRLVFFSFAYATSPAAVMKLVVFLRSSKPPYNFWWSGVAGGYCEMVVVCYISEEHARLSGPLHHRDTLGKERVLVSCACVRWACCGRNAVVPKPPDWACQEGGMTPFPFWVSALFWWWWSFPGNGCWLMVALPVLRIWLADLLARCQGFRSVLGSIGELLCMCCRVLVFVLLGEKTCL